MVYNILQLRSQKVRKMAEILERTKSSYFTAFKILFRDVVEGNAFYFYLKKQHGITKMEYLKQMCLQH